MGLYGTLTAPQSVSAALGEVVVLAVGAREPKCPIYGASLRAT